MSNNTSSKMTLVPVMITFFTMGFVDLVGAVSNNMQEDFGLSDSAANFFPFSTVSCRPRRASSG